IRSGKHNANESTEFLPLLPILSANRPKLFFCICPIHNTSNPVRSKSILWFLFSPDFALLSPSFQLAWIYVHHASKESHKRNKADHSLPKFSDKHNDEALWSIARPPIHVCNLPPKLSIIKVNHVSRNIDPHRGFPFPNRVCIVQKDIRSRKPSPPIRLLFAERNPELCSRFLPWHCR